MLTTLCLVACLSLRVIVGKIILLFSCTDKKLVSHHRVSDLINCTVCWSPVNSGNRLSVVNVQVPDYSPLCIHPDHLFRSYACGGGRERLVSPSANSST